FTLNNANLTFAASGGVPFTFSGIGSVTGINEFTISATGDVYFNGQLTNGASPGQLSILGAQTLFLTNANFGGTPNSYSGGTLLGGTATVVVNDGSALGTGALGFNGGTLLASNPVTFTNPYIINANTTISGTSSANNVTLTSNALLTGSATLTVANL